MIFEDLRKKWRKNIPYFLENTKISKERKGGEYTSIIVLLSQIQEMKN